MIADIRRMHAVLGGRLNPLWARLDDGKGTLTNRQGAMFIAAIVLLSAWRAYGAAPGDEPWRPMARACFAQIEQTCGGNCEERWPDAARCTAANYFAGQIPAPRLEICMKQVWDRHYRNWPKVDCPVCNGYDPIAETFWCAAR